MVEMAEDKDNVHMQLLQVGDFSIIIYRHPFLCRCRGHLACVRETTAQCFAQQTRLLEHFLLHQPNTPCCPRDPLMPVLCILYSTGITCCLHLGSQLPRCRRLLQQAHAAAQSQQNAPQQSCCGFDKSQEQYQFEMRIHNNFVQWFQLMYCKVHGNCVILASRTCGRTLSAVWLGSRSYCINACASWSSSSLPPLERAQISMSWLSHSSPGPLDW